MAVRDNNKYPFRSMEYCKRCCMPGTTEGIGFDELGICKACRASEEKMKIDWEFRAKAFGELLNKHKELSGDGYDCMVPISGGKDSAFQLHVLTKVYGLKPLAVTFSHNWYSKKGWENLWNVLERLDVDHIMYTPKRSLVNRLAKNSLPAIGDSCWHCHAGVLSFPLHIAVKFGIKLLVFGESPADFSGRDTYFDKKFDMQSAVNTVDIFMQGSVRVKPDDMRGDNIEKQEMVLFNPPSKEELIKAQISSVYLGDYIFWDHERQTEFLVEEYGWQEDRVEGNYKRYKSVECRMPGVHDYSKFIKRGYGRSTDFASQDVRAGLLTREEAFEVAFAEDSRRPDVLDYYLEITGYTEEEFHQILEDMRIGKAKELPSFKPEEVAKRKAQKAAEKNKNA